jgi:hypothetical protein
VVDTGAGVVAAVEPVVVPAGGALGRTRGEENVVLIESTRNGSVALSGPGAGGAPTAGALLADLLRGAGRLGRPPAQARHPVADAREHAWALSIARTAGAPGTLGRTLARAGVSSSAVLADVDRLVAVCRPVAWPRIDLALRALSAERLTIEVKKGEWPAVQDYGVCAKAHGPVSFP